MSVTIKSTLRKSKTLEGKRDSKEGDSGSDESEGAAKWSEKIEREHSKILDME